MRTSGLRQAWVGGRARAPRSHRSTIATPAAVLLLAAVAAGCSAGAATTPSPPSPTAVPTPDPHLSEPASADEIFLALQRAGLALRPNAAESGRDEPRKRISATYAGWPLVVSEFSSARALRDAFASAPAATGRAPYALAGLNVLVEFGPRETDASPSPPDADHHEAVLEVVEILDPLLGPLEQFAGQSLGLRTPAPPTPEVDASP